ncbi:MAG: methyl-accepting chemotaxis protein, partial [Firmicutes bacterium]|nr:methyl-accepting chemotaxis protein [Bacillota bacterium]
GFAVVAGEVSKLADDSSSSAKKIKDLVSGIIDEIDGLTSNIKVQTKVIGENVAYAKKALDKSDTINEAVEENRKTAEAIVSMTARQKENIEEIRNAIQIINETTQQNAAVSEEITASTEEQLSIIETMYNSVVTLNNAIEYSNSIMEGFTTGFKITDDIKAKIEKTKILVENISKSNEINHLTGRELQDYLMAKQKTLSYIEFIALVNDSGWITDSSIEIPDTEVDRQCTSRLYYQEAIKGKLFVSKEYISIITGNYNITVSIPIYRNGKTAGIVFADINLND